MSIVLDIINTRKWLEKLVKLFAVYFLFLIGMLVSAQSWQNTKGGFVCAHTTTEKQPLSVII